MITKPTETQTILLASIAGLVGVVVVLPLSLFLLWVVMAWTR